MKQPKYKFGQNLYFQNNNDIWCAMVNQITHTNAGYYYTLGNENIGKYGLYEHELFENPEDIYKNLKQKLEQRLKSMKEG